MAAKALEWAVAAIIGVGLFLWALLLYDPGALSTNPWLRW